MTRLPRLPTLPKSDAPDPTFTRLVAAERNNRVLADVLWRLSDADGCYCRVKSDTHERRCSDARSALLMSMGPR